MATTSEEAWRILGELTEAQKETEIIEVLSDPTEAFGRGDKFANYQTLETLEEYVLINTRHQWVECFQCNEDKLWVLRYYTENEFILTSLDFSAPLSTLYEDVSLG